MKKYVIVGEYCMGTEYSNCFITYWKQMFLGIEGEMRIYIYNDSPTEGKTLIFDKKKDAAEYIKEHELNNNEFSVNTRNHKVVEIELDMN